MQGSLIACSRFAEFDLRSLRICIMAGAPCPPELLGRVMGAMHCPEILVGYGEEVVAWVRLRPGGTEAEDEIRAFCRGQLAHFKVPRRIWFVEEFPMTVTGKVRKFRMPDITLGWLASPYAAPADSSPWPGAHR